MSGVTDPSAATHSALAVQARLNRRPHRRHCHRRDGVPVGAAVTAIDGRPAARWLDDRVRLKSGTTQWTTELTLRVMECEQGTTVNVTLDDGGRPAIVPLVCGPKTREAAAGAAARAAGASSSPGLATST